MGEKGNFSKVGKKLLSGSSTIKRGFALGEKKKKGKARISSTRRGDLHCPLSKEPLKDPPYEKAGREHSPYRTTLEKEQLDSPREKKNSPSWTEKRTHMYGILKDRILAKKRGKGATSRRTGGYLVG